MRVERIATIATVIGGLAFLLWLVWFHVVDSDFWWHIKAGELMLKNGWIALDPFAWTREGLPYVATHEWLTQIFYYGVFSGFGAAGIVGLRWVAACAITGLLLSIDRKNIWPNLFLVLSMMLVMRQGLIERPQLLSNVIFAAMLVLSLSFMNQSARPWKGALVMMVLLQILWVNLHGGAAILSLMLIGSVAAQTLVTDRSTLKMLVVAGLLLLFALLISPNGFHTVTYVWLLFTDQTSQFIQEWNPRAWPTYLVQFGPFWIAALGSLAWSRKNVIAIGLILLATGVLSRMGTRHEALFLIAAAGCTFYELRHNERWQSLMIRVKNSWLTTSVLTVILFIWLIMMNLPYQRYLERRNNAGIGIFSPALGAAEFIEQENVRGRMFNTYRIGGYLLYNDLKVFLDGRNVDYGYAYLKPALDARHDGAVFRSLEAKYPFTVAVIEYAPNSSGTLEFEHMHDDPDWALVFVDDWTAVYLKRTPENASLIAEKEFSVLTPQLLKSGVLPATGNPQLETELRRAVADDTRGISSLLLLGKLLRGTGRFDEAEVPLREAMRRMPARYEAYDMLASIRAVQEKWDEAADLYDLALDRIKGLNVQPPMEKIEEVYRKAGRTP